MKKFLALVLAVLMALSCISFAGAETGTTIPGTSDTQCNNGKDHQWNDVSGSTIASTCQVAGSKKQKCSVCGAEQTVALPLAEHVKAANADTSVVSYATCTAPEIQKVSKCQNCGQAYEVTFGTPLGHDWKAGTKVAETCTTDGYTPYTCSRCSATENRDLVPKHEFHKSAEAKPVNQAPTCETLGLEGEVYYCTLCGYVPKTFKDEDGHDVNNTAKYVDKLVHKATDFFSYDEEDGEKYCTGFNPEFLAALNVADVYPDAAFEKTVDLSKSLHYGKTVTVKYQPATCTEDGFVSVVCSCDPEKTWLEVLPAHKHRYVMVAMEYFSANQYEEFAFSAFGRPVYFEEFLSVLEKIQSDGWSGVEIWFNRKIKVDDCTKPILFTYKCLKCGDVQNGKLNPCTEHTWVVDHYTQMKYGTQRAGAFDHFRDINECTDYTVEYKCRFCAQTKSEKKDGKGHSFSGENAEVLEEATCAKEGLKVVRCDYGDCQKLQLVTLPKTPHDPNAVKETVIKAASCTEEGEIEYECSVCKQKWTKVTPSMGGHQWKTIYTVEPTCTKKGHAKVVCAVCGLVKEEYDVPEGHKIPDTLTTAVNAELVKVGNEYTIQWKDCTKDGEATYVCANEKCCQRVIVKHTACADHTWKKNGDPIIVSVVKKDEESHTTTFKQNYICETCPTGKKSVEFTEDSSHTEDEDAPIYKLEAATCEKPGLYLKHCAECDSYYKESYTENHLYASEYDPETDKWSYRCIWCDATKDIEFTTPSFNIDTTKVNWANKTTGTVTVTLKDDVAYLPGDYYALVRWTWVSKDGCDVVADKVVRLTRTSEGYTFDARGFSVSGATLTEMLIVITDNPKADEINLGSVNRFGYTALTK